MTKCDLIPQEAGVYKGRPYKGDKELDALAETVIEILRPEGLPIWQVKEVMDRVKALVDFERIK